MLCFPKTKPVFFQKTGHRTSFSDEKATAASPPNSSLLRSSSLIRSSSNLRTQKNPQRLHSSEEPPIGAIRYSSEEPPYVLHYYVVTQTTTRGACYNQCFSKELIIKAYYSILFDLILFLFFLVVQNGAFSTVSPETVRTATFRPKRCEPHRFAHLENIKIK